MSETSLSENVARVLDRIRAAEARAGRASGSVRLMAVTKGFPAGTVDEAVAAGLTLIGENRVQEAAQKRPRVAAPAEWHLIGHLQRNKVAAALELFDAIQSVDSERLALAIDARAAASARRARVLIEVNVAGEEAKTGLAANDLVPLLQRARSLGSLEVEGLMGMAPWTDDERAVRAAFARLRWLGDDAMARGLLRPPAGRLELSMGMSGDFEAAILEGSTMVRVGRALFGERRGA